MNGDTYNRLTSLRLENDAAGFAMDEMRPRFARMAARHENGTAPRAVSAFQLFQTPSEIAERMVFALEFWADARVLEPSAGLGRIMDALAPRQPREVVAVEMSAPIAAELYRQERPGVKLIQRDFLICTPVELGLFDAIAMNPPFHMRADIRHILHARTFLKPGGMLVALCLNTRHRAEALRPIASTWEELPETTFAKEGTRVSIVMLTIRA